MVFKDFFVLCSRARGELSLMKRPLIVHHYDCDGVCSGAIVGKFFEDRGVSPRFRVERKLDESIVSKLCCEKEIVFCDLGSGCKHVDELSGSVVILDHHQVEATRFQVNPEACGLDGGVDGCASSVCALACDTGFELAVVGTVGDVQDPKRGLNNECLKRAVDADLVSVSTDLRLFGRESRPLPALLSYADDPVLPGLTGNDVSSSAFCASTGIKDAVNRCYSSLTQKEKQEFFGHLSDYLVSSGYSRLVRKLVGDVYTLLNRPKDSETRDASEFSTLLNACGRNDRAELGVEVCLEKLGALSQAQSLLQAHRRALRDGVVFAMQNTQDFGNFKLIDARGTIPDSIIGIVAGMTLYLNQDKPVLALSLDPQANIKASGRASKKLVDAGFNWGKILKESCQPLNGSGGGHRAAAGCTIPKDKVPEFLENISQTISKEKVELK